MHTLDRPIRAFILDDEIDACKNLAILLERYWGDKISIIGIANSTAEAEQSLVLNPPDVLFIDIEMPKENAFQFLERIGQPCFEIVFVTAYDEYALKALKISAIDYILKPIHVEELGIAIEKLEHQIVLKKNYEIKNEPHVFSHLLNQINKKEKPHSIVLRNNNEYQIVAFKDIAFIEAKSSYANVIFFEEKKQRSIIMSSTIGEYEDILPQEMFYRIHKTYLMNVIHFVKIHKGLTLNVELINNTILPISRRRYNGFIDFLKTHKKLDK